jgi:hypothetical protein
LAFINYNNYFFYYILNVFDSELKWFSIARQELYPATCPEWFESFAFPPASMIAACWSLTILIVEIKGSLSIFFFL